MTIQPTPPTSDAIAQALQEAADDIHSVVSDDAIIEISNRAKAIDRAREIAAQPGEGGSMAVACINAGIRAATRQYRDALTFYARHEHWMQVSENAEATTLLIAGGPTGSLDGWTVAENALATIPSPPHVADALDGERLDWLALHPRGAQIVVNGEVKDCIFWGLSSDPEYTLREAIDAARAEVGGVK